VFIFADGWLARFASYILKSKLFKIFHALSNTFNNTHTHTRTHTHLSSLFLSNIQNMTIQPDLYVSLRLSLMQKCSDDQPNPKDPNTHTHTHLVSFFLPSVSTQVINCVLLLLTECPYVDFAIS